MIINGYTDYIRLIDRMSREKFVYTEIYRDIYYHPVENKVLCVGIMFENTDHFVVSVSHEDVSTFDIMSELKNPIYQSFSNVQINNLIYIHEKRLPNKPYPTYIADIHNKFGKMKDVNRVIPISVWTTALEEHNFSLWQSLQKYNDGLNTDAYKFLNKLTNILQKIETSGLAVNHDILIEKFGDKIKRSFKGNFVYSQYNPYTTTGRPSNRFGGINFSALNKSDGSRDAFVSRYNNGILVQIDFEAYHLRLIADYLNVSLPTGKSIHKELAKIYFNTDDIDQSMYEASKQKTFEIMYGITNESFGFELFEKIHSERMKLCNMNTISLPSGISLTVEDATPSKLFNYYVQSLEVVSD